MKQTFPVLVQSSINCFTCRYEIFFHYRWSTKQKNLYSSVENYWHEHTVSHWNFNCTRSAVLL